MGEITFALVRSLPGVVKIRLAQVVIFRLSFAILIVNGLRPGSTARPTAISHGVIWSSSCKKGMENDSLLPLNRVLCSIWQINPSNSKCSIKP